MKKSGGGAAFWIVLLLVAGGLNLFNLRAKRALEAELAALPRESVAAGAVAGDLFRASRLMALSHTGRFLKFPDALKDTGLPRYRVILAVSERSCGSCRDSETKFVTELADKIGDDQVQIIVYAESPRYLASYREVNGIHLPVGFDPEGAFFEANGIMETPMTFLVNDRNEVIAAHFPTPNRPDMSEPFREMLHQFFGVAKGVAR